jgi:hypothetical protein
MRVRRWWPERSSSRRGCPGHGITIAFVARAIFRDRELRTRALTAPRFAESAVALLRERAA